MPRATKSQLARRLQRNGILSIRRTPGLQIRLARHLGISRQAVSAWKTVPLGQLDKVFYFTGIPKRLLRPDIYFDDIHSFNREWTKFFYEDKPTIMEALR